MKVSILITNYNYDKYLSRCIRSCVNQRFDDYEIIIVDDNSQDDSYKILNQASKNFKNIRLHYNDVNIGLGASCAKGVSMARGKYIVRVDADDYISEDFLKLLYLYASFNNAHAVACDYFEVDFDENIINRLSQKDAPIACGILFRTDVLEAIGSYGDLRKNEDKDLMKRFEKRFIMNYLEIPLYRYFKHKESLTGRDNEK